MSGFRAKGFICLIGIVLGMGPVACARGEGLLKDRDALRLTQADDGREITVKAAESFEVVLPEVPTSGYLWAVHEIDPDYLRLESEAYAEPSPDERRVGGGREKIFTFKALKAGGTALELWLRRPWEEPEKHIKSFEIKLKIET